jgi:transposase
VGAGRQVADAGGAGGRLLTDARPQSRSNSRNSDRVATLVGLKVRLGDGIDASRRDATVASIAGSIEPGPHKRDSDAALLVESSHPASLQVDRRARRAKTDRVDVERMLRSLLAYLRGEPKVWSVVRVPSVAEEDDRRLHRERGRLINERVQHVNRIKGLLAIHGIYDYQPLRRDRVRRLEQLHTADGQTLPPRLKAEILRELQRLELAIGMIKTIEAQRDAIASAKTGHTSAKKIQHLAKIKSIGPEFATALVGEVFYRSFDNRKQLASYVGLTPAHFQSGAMSRDQGISKAGNAKARTVMIELAWLWLRHQPDSPLSVWFRERVGKLKGRIRRITIVAVARKLLIALWRYLENGLVPEGAILKVK